jgi:hypothetical protein
LKLSTRIAIFFAAFLVLTIVTAFASTAKISLEEARSLNSSVAGISPTTLPIFFNNARVDLVEFIPVLGPAFGVYVSYDTGIVIAAIAETSSLPIGGPEAFLSLIITPIFWMEFFAYSLAVEESVALIVSARKRALFRAELRWLAGSVLLALAVLFVSAHLEATIVNVLG